MKLKALRDEVLIRPIQKEKTQGGIIISEKVSTSSRGEVVSVGDHVLRYGKEVDAEVTEGDIVFFSRGTGKLVDTEDEKLFMLKHTDILGKIP